MFRKVTGAMFQAASYYEDYWKSRGCKSFRSKFYRECFSQNPIPVKMDIESLKKSFKDEFSSSKDIMKHYLSESIISDLENIVKNNGEFDTEIWAEIVYNYAAAYKKTEREPDKYLLLDSLKTLWIGRFVSYAIETKDMNINEAETVIQKQAEVFEEKINYLISIYCNEQINKCRM